MTTYQTPDCVCNSKEPHFCPPCMGDPGFFACKPEDVIDEVHRLRAKLKVDHLHQCGTSRQFPSLPHKSWALQPVERFTYYKKFPVLWRLGLYLRREGTRPMIRVKILQRSQP